MPSKPMTLRALLLACACATLTSGCTLGPDFQRPDAPGNTGYGMAGDHGLTPDVKLGTSPAGAWWRAFGSRRLNLTVEQALAGSTTLVEARAALAEAQAGLAQANGGRVPSLDLNAGAQRERLNLASFGFGGGLPGFSNNPEFSLYSVGASAAYPLDTFGGLRREVEAATARREVAAHEADAAALALTGQVAAQAAAIAALSAEIAALDDVAKEDARTLALVRKARAAGGVGEGQVGQAEAQGAADAALLPPLRQQLAAARHALAVLVGHAPADWTAPDFTLDDFRLPSALPVSLPSQLVRKRPDILAAEARLHAANAEVGVATANQYPSLSLTAALTQSALKPGDVFDTPATAYTLGAGLTAPLFDGGRRRAARRAALARAEAAEARYRGSVAAAFGQVADLLEALGHDDERLMAQTEAVAAAEKSLRLARLAYQAGGTGVLPVIDAERSWQTARRALIAAHAQRIGEVIGLYVATASDWTASSAPMPSAR